MRLLLLFLLSASPIILVGSSSRQKEEIRQGQDLHLRCLATGHPEPNYQWLKDDTPIASTSIPIGAGASDRHVEMTTVSKRYALHDQGRELVVFATTSADNGTYTCIAVNSVGRDRHNIAVSVMGMQHGFYFFSSFSTDCEIHWEIVKKLTSYGFKRTCR